MINELEKEEEKYRKIYEEKSQIDYVVYGLKADAFRLAITRIENKGLKDTYLYLKKQRDIFSSDNSNIGRKLSNAYGLVIGKLWKYYKKLKKED